MIQSPSQIRANIRVTTSNLSLPTLATIGAPDELQLSCSTLGASIVSLKVPGPAGYVDVVLGYADQHEYLKDNYYLGAMCGRYAGRIKHAKFELDGQSYKIDTNDHHGHALHGGTNGFNQRLWELTAAAIPNALSYRLKSEDGDQGFPGNLNAQVTYSIRNKNLLVIDVVAETDQATVVNLVNHAYFNLAKHDSPINEHRVWVKANHITVQSEDGIPNGSFAPVAGTRFDLRNASTGRSHDLLTDRLGRALRDQKFDQNFVLDKPAGELGLAATAYVVDAPIALAVYTTLPGLHVYTGDYLSGPLVPRSGLCLEAQYFPDAPNHMHFPSTVLRPGETLREQTIYAFGPLDKITKFCPTS